MTHQVGMLCYDCHSGLGHLARAFYKHGVTHRALVIPHPRYERHPEWYPPGVGFAPPQWAKFLDGIEALMIFENAFNQWGTVAKAKGLGIKIILIPMYEWTPQPLPVSPDLVICPSDLDMVYFEEHYRCVRMTIPFDSEVHRPHWRDRAKEFVHNAGHGQVGLTKGTPEVLEAFSLVKCDAKLLVRGQSHEEKRVKELFDAYRGSHNIEFIEGNVPDEELYQRGDVFINAEQYNGLSLPLQEAYGSGMLVMTTDRFPANIWLPREPLIPVNSREKHRLNHTTFERCRVLPETIARKIDEWYGKEIHTYSLSGINWGDNNGWDVWKPIYEDTIERLVNGNL